jgi:hypothetical protein
LVLFGSNIIAARFGYSLFLGIFLFSDVSGEIFSSGDPADGIQSLTIIFWGGVFFGQNGGKRNQQTPACLFGLGGVLSTLIFLSMVAVAAVLQAVFCPILSARF